MKILLICGTVCISLLIFIASLLFCVYYGHHPDTSINFPTTSRKNGNVGQLPFPPLLSGYEANYVLHFDLPFELKPDCIYTREDYTVILLTIDRILVYFEFFIEEVGKIMDATVALRILEDQIGAIIKSHGTLPKEMQMSLNALVGRARRLREHIIMRTRKHKTEVSPLDWKNHHVWSETPGLWEWPAAGEGWANYSVMKSYESPEGIIVSPSEVLGSEDYLLWHVSDVCIYEITKCGTIPVADDCKKVFLEKTQHLYSLTHQVIYTMFAIKSKCNDVKDAATWKTFLETLCGQVWLEANALGLTGFPAEHRDLFLEQIAICGMGGYPNFLNRKWLRQTLSWRSSTHAGCFVLKREHPKQYDEIKIKGTNETCSTHFTSVALSNLVVHLRYLLHSCVVS